MSKTIYSLEELNAQVATLEGQIGTGKGLATAWALVDGLTGNLISGFNVSGSSRISTGYYELVFSTPLDNINYAVTGGGAVSANENGFSVGMARTDAHAKNVNNVRVVSREEHSTTTVDVALVSVVIHGGKN